MINPASLSSKGKVYYNTNTENSRGGGERKKTKRKKRNPRETQAQETLCDPAHPARQ